MNWIDEVTASSVPNPSVYLAEHWHAGAGCTPSVCACPCGLCGVPIPCVDNLVCANCNQRGRYEFNSRCVTRLALKEKSKAHD